MDFLKKIFILIPGEKETGKLVLALLFYVFVPYLACGLVGTILGPVGIVALGVYGLIGAGKSVLAYMGKDLKDLCCKGE